MVTTCSRVSTEYMDIGKSGPLGNKPQDPKPQIEAILKNFIETPISKDPDTKEQAKKQAKLLVKDPDSMSLFGGNRDCYFGVTFERDTTNEWSYSNYTLQQLYSWQGEFFLKTPAGALVIEHSHPGCFLLSIPERRYEMQPQNIHPTVKLIAPDGTTSTLNDREMSQNIFQAIRNKCRSNHTEKQLELLHEAFT